MSYNVLHKYEDFADTIPEKKIFVDSYTKKLYNKEYFVFDSETSTIKEGDNTYATPILFQIGNKENVLFLRDPDELIKTFDKMSKDFSIGGKKTLVFVHNLTYDIFFLLDKMLTKMKKTFIIRGKIARFTYKNLEFRCSLQLTRLSLKTAIKIYSKLRTYDKTDTWDYNKIRTVNSILTNGEILYGAMDCVAFYYMLGDLAELHSCSVQQLPLTNTGFIRRLLEKEMLGELGTRTEDQQKYSMLMRRLKICYSSLALATACFNAGVTGVNPKHANKYIEHIISFDMSSQYPFVMCTQRFPMSTPLKEDITEEELINICSDETKGFLVRFTVRNLELVKEIPIPIGKKRKWEKGDRGIIDNNMRIYTAEQVTLSFNSVDFKLFIDQYKWETMEIEEYYSFKMKYLPTQLVKFILKHYGNKTLLKDNDEETIRYMISKVIVNSIFGVNAQHPLNDEYDIDDEKGIYKILHDTNDMITEIDDYNNKSRATYYLWGQYTSSHAHTYLYQVFDVLGTDIINCDTDSAKGKYKEEYITAIEQINEEIEERLHFIADVHDIDVELFFPCTEEGVEKPLGVWESEMESKYGKLIGITAKRSKCYILRYENGYKCVVAGISEEYLKKALEDVETHGYTTPEEAFINNIDIAPEKSGKLTHQYVLGQDNIVYVGDDNTIGTVWNSSAVVLEPAPFSFKDKGVLNDVFTFAEKLDNFNLIA